MELYYDLARQGVETGYISKGWTDPGFRVGNLLATDLPLCVVRALVDPLRDFCATNGVSITVSGDHHRREIVLEYVLYSTGFNVETFAEAMKTFLKVRTKVMAGLVLAERVGGRIHLTNEPWFYQ
jgi:hypothetical protein